jgi:hypothetical protein
MTTALLPANTASTPGRDALAATSSRSGLRAVVAAAAARWRGRVERNAWLLLEPFLPGTTLFVLLVVLSFGYLRRGFGAVRQHAFAPDAGQGVAHAATRRRWWHCPCASLLACRCWATAANRVQERTTQWARSVCAACR